MTKKRTTLYIDKTPIESLKNRGISISQIVSNYLSNYDKYEKAKVVITAYRELFSFLKEVSESSILNSKNNNDLWNELLNRRNITLLDKAKGFVINERLIIK